MSEAGPTVTFESDGPIAARIRGRTAADLLVEIQSHPHGRVPRELRFAHVLAVATDLFIERGYQQASMDELARRAGVSKPVVYALVGSKDEVFQVAMASSADELAERVALAVAGARDDVVAQMRAGALAFFDFVQERREAWGALMHSSDAPVTEAVADIRRRQGELVGRLFEEAARTQLGTLTAMEVARAHLLACSVNGAFESAAAWWYEHPDVAITDVAELALSLVQPGLADLGEAIGDA